MAAARDFRYEQLCDKQAGLDQLAGCYRALRDRDLLRAGQAEAAVAAPHRACRAVSLRSSETGV